MKFEGFDFCEVQEEGSNVLVEKFIDWSQELTKIIEDRVFCGGFKGVVDRISRFGDEVIDRLTDEEKEDQLVICSQYKFTLLQLRDEIGRYKDRIGVYFETWIAECSVKIRNSLLEEQKKEVRDGTRTKSSCGQVSSQEIRDRILVDYKDEYLKWKLFMERLNRAFDFVSNLVTDLEHRSYILMHLRKF